MRGNQLRRKPIEREDYETGLLVKAAHYRPLAGKRSDSQNDDDDVCTGKGDNSTVLKNIRERGCSFISAFPVKISRPLLAQYEPFPYPVAA